MLRLDNLHKRFGSVTALDGLSLTVPRGSVFGLLGPNGAGKTTAISIAVGLLRPDSGSVDLDGAGSPIDPAVRRRIGVAPQAIALYDDMTAMENLEFFATLYELDRPSRRDRSRALLARVGLTDRAGDRVKGYSGGMKRRLNLAAALIHDPPVVLLDEPTAGVDPQSRNAILDLVLSLRDEGRTVVYTTHYMEEAQRICDRVAIVDHGKVLAEGSVDQLIASLGGASIVTIQTDSEQVRIETADPVAELSVRLRSPDIRGIRVDRPDLESVFLHLTGRSLRD